ncbi:MAG: PAS domain-containing protein [Planctomycetales bacterium]|nr:PAS domain-containing protein [Planctomycetales bacterium]
MERFSSRFSFLAPAAFAAAAGFAVSRLIRHDASLDWVAAGAVAVGAVCGAAYWMRGLVRRQLLASARDASHGRPQLTERLPGLLPLLHQLRDARGIADMQTDAFAHADSRLKSVLEAMQDAVLAVDVREAIVFANHAAERLLNLPANVSGKHVLHVVRDHRLLELVRQCRGVCEHRQLEYQVEGRVIEVRATPQFLDGSAIGVVLVFRDVSDRRRLESMRRDFVANVSHELKTPLSNIKAYTDTLMNGAVEDLNVRDLFLGRITEQADRLNELILDLISLARIEGGKQTFDMTEVALKPLVEHCVQQRRLAIEERELQMTVDVPVDVVVFADEEGIRQIVDNLLSNAIKYARSAVRVRCCSIGEEVELRVDDDGQGIAEPHLERLFERFYRVDRARARELGGTGLGLSIVKHLVLAFHGHVGVESAVGHGASFWVTLPTAPAKRKPEA